jgi:hypothetical protein
MPDDQVLEDLQRLNAGRSIFDEVYPDWVAALMWLPPR